MKAFISYAREDSHIAEKLRNDLEKAGINTWLDRKDLLPGDNWRAVIRKNIKESDYFIILLSSNSISKRGFIQSELKMALDELNKFPSDQIFVIPVRIDNCEPKDERLQDIHWADLFPSYKKGVNHILKVFEPNKKSKNKYIKFRKAWIIFIVLLAIVVGISFYNAIESGIFRSDYSGQDSGITDKKSPKGIGSNRIAPDNNTEVRLPTLYVPGSKQEQVKPNIKFENKIKPGEKKMPKSSMPKREDADNNNSILVKQNFTDDSNNKYKKDGKTIIANKTRLMWQQSGSNFLTYEEAKEYIKHLNQIHFEGYNDWRLPTKEELISLVEHNQNEDNLYIDQIFDQKQKYCWTSEQNVDAYVCQINFVNNDDTYISPQSHSFVRAVRSLN